jgi:biopolymer transport protein ExbD
MARKRRKNDWVAGELNLTAMIDVAFQLLNFFLIAAHPIDVYTKLSIIRPMADKSATQATAVKLLTVMVLPKTYVINDREMDFEELGLILEKLAALDKDQTVLIQCLNQAPHKQLIGLLDLCAQLGLTNLSVVSSGGA